MTFLRQVRWNKLWQFFLVELILRVKAWSSQVLYFGRFEQGILKGDCTVDLLFDWFGISCKTTDNFCFYLQNTLIQTSQTGGQWYSDTSPFSIPWFVPRNEF